MPLVVDAQAPEDAAWNGALPPAAGGAALLTVKFALPPADLARSPRSGGCHTETFAVTEQGAWKLYVPGAPDFVNTGFPEQCGSGVPLAVRCSAPHRLVPLDVDDAGSWIVLQVGRPVRLTLPSDPSGGYAWRVEPALAPGVLAPGGAPAFVPDSLEPNAPGRVIFEFDAAGAGALRLALVEERAGSDAPAREWSVALKIVQS